MPGTRYVDDFDQLWITLGQRYCYFGEKKTDWTAVRALYRPRARAAGSAESFAEVIRLVLAELYDAHTHVAKPARGTPYWPPYDLLVEPQAGGARVIAIYEGSAAQDAGILHGDLITRIADERMSVACARYRPKCQIAPDPAAARYAANVAAGGLRGQTRHFEILRRNKHVQVDVPEKHYPDLPDIEARPLAGGYGLIVIRSFANDDLISRFDSALQSLSRHRGLIIDVRYNGGGDTAIARPIMGRFIHERRKYALMRRRLGEGLSAPWSEFVEARGPFTYDKPVVVLCGTWSASMAEGFTMGMRDIGQARIVGTPMMGLGAGVYDITLNRTGLRAQFSAEPVYDVNGVPRSALKPDVMVGAGEDALQVGLAQLERLIATSRRG